MATLWLVRRGKKITAPLTTEQLKQCANNGQVKPEDMIAKAGTEKWQRADRVKGLGLRIPEPSRGEIAESSGMRPTSVPPISAGPPVGEASEEIVWSGGPSQVINIGAFIFHGLITFVLLAMFWLILPLALLPIPIGIITKRWLKTRSIRYELTTERLRVSTGILSRATHEWELYRVKDTTLSQTFFERYANLGSVTVHSSDRSKANVTLFSVANPGELREQIRTLTEKRRDAKGVREIEHT